MRNRLRAGGLAAPLLALAASTASATPPAISGASAAIVAPMAPSDTATLQDNAITDAANQRSETEIHSIVEAGRTANVISGVNTMPSESVMRRLHKLVRAYESDDAPDTAQKCLAGAIYFEARGEPLEGQLAVAEVVLNRAASGQYPASICEVVTQPAQFSFVRDGLVPPIDETSVAWRTALAVAHIADEKLANELAPNVLWYHADYVAPSWDRHLAPVIHIGAHIFYRRA